MPASMRTKADRVRQGFCELCGKNEFTRGSKTCRTCKEKQNERQRKYRAKQTKVPICTRCKYNHPVLNLTVNLCAACEYFKDNFEVMIEYSQGAAAARRGRATMDKYQIRRAGFTGPPMPTEFLNDYQTLIYDALEYYEADEHLGFTMQTLPKMFPESVDDWTKTEHPKVASQI